MRLALPALLLLAAAGCHDEDELTVVNTGTEAVLIDIDWDADDGWWSRGHHRLVELPAGGIYNDEFGRVGEMEVVILRKSDGLLLFADELDADDFDDDHGNVEISVSP